jgi:hypothetical protein
MDEKVLLTMTEIRLAQLDKIGKKLNPVRNVLAGVMAVGGACIVAYAWLENGVRAVAVGLLLALALFAIGALVGFLFGAPHTVPASSPPASLFAKASLSGASSPGADQQLPLQRYLPSTHLEDISDWLTKILVGIGLTQIQNLPAALAAFSAFAARGISDGTSTPPLIVGIMLVFTVCGFFFGYLWCRLILARLQTAADTP